MESAQARAYRALAELCGAGFCGTKNPREVSLRGLSLVRDAILISRSNADAVSASLYVTGRPAQSLVGKLGEVFALDPFNICFWHSYLSQL